MFLQLGIYKLGAFQRGGGGWRVSSNDFSPFFSRAEEEEEKNANNLSFVPLSRLSRNSAASRRTAILIFTHRYFLYLFTPEKFLLLASKWLFLFLSDHFFLFCVARWILCQEFFLLYVINIYLQKFSKYKLDFLLFFLLFIQNIRKIITRLVLSLCRKNYTNNFFFLFVCF